MASSSKASSSTLIADPLIPATEIFDFLLKSENTSKRKMITANAASEIAKAFNLEFEDQKINISQNGSGIRNDLFSKLETGSFDLKFLNSEALKDTIKHNVLLTGNGQKCTDFFVSKKSCAKPKISVPCAEPKICEPSGTTPTSLVAMLEALKTGKSLKSCHPYTTIHTKAAEGAETVAAAPILGAGVAGSAPTVLNTTFNLGKDSDDDDDGDWSMKDIKNCLASILQDVITNSKAIETNKSMNEVTAYNINQDIINKNKILEERLDEVEEEVYKNASQITTLLKIQDEFDTIQELLGLDFPEGEEKDKDELKDQALNPTSKLMLAIEDSIRSNVNSSLSKISDGVMNKLTDPLEIFLRACKETTNYIHSIKQSGALKCIISRDAEDDFITVLEDGTKSFNHTALKRLFGCSYRVNSTNFGATGKSNQTFFHLECHRKDGKLPREVANELLERRADFAGKLGISWAVHPNDWIIGRLIRLKDSQIISNFLLGKSARWVIMLNDGSAETYNAFSAATTAKEIKDTRNAYIKSCSSLRIDAPSLFTELGDEIVNDYDKMKKVINGKAFYAQGDVHDFDEEYLKKNGTEPKTGTRTGRRTKIATDRRNLKWVTK